MTNLHPWRQVTAVSYRSGRGSLLGGDTTRRSRWWDLTLDCGHHAERTCRYRPRSRRDGTQRRSTDDILPAPGRVLCHQCPAA